MASQHSRRRVMATLLPCLIGACAVSYLVIPEGVDEPAAAVSTTVPPRPIPEVTTPAYSMQVAATKMLNDVAAQGGFVPHVADIQELDGTVTRLEDANNDDLDDDGLVQLSRGDDVVCIQLPSEEDGSRVMAISAGACQP